MIALPLFLAAAAGVVGFYVSRRKVKRRFLASTEYWVYIPGVEMPPQDRIMHRMLADNPFNRPGDQILGKAEGMLFSDIRTHIALVLRAKNSHIFTPDQLSEDVELSKADLERLEQCQALVKVRYISDTFRLRFMHPVRSRTSRMLS